jgi:CPA2 family monovalent cation:H+ antiporter-2
LDTVLLGAVLVGAAQSFEWAGGFAVDTMHVDPAVGHWSVVAVAVAIAAPFCFGIVRLAYRVSGIVAGLALPATATEFPDLAFAPRKALVAILQFAIVLLVGVPVLAVTQPFYPGYEGALILLALVAVAGIVFWRNAANLHGHVQAGAQAIAEALVTQARGGRSLSGEPSLEGVQPLLPGLGEPTPITLEATSAAVGKTLAMVNLRGATGATVLAICRGTDGIPVPGAGEVLRAGDVLALAGTHEAIRSAEVLLRSGEFSES